MALHSWKVHGCSRFFYGRAMQGGKIENCHAIAPLLSGLGCRFEAVKSSERSQTVPAREKKNDTTNHIDAIVWGSGR